MFRISFNNNSSLFLEIKVPKFSGKYSFIPPTLVEITGKPQENASKITQGKFS